MKAANHQPAEAGLTNETAIAFADCALRAVSQCYPYAAQHLQRSDDDCAPPHAVHPIFHGSYDWHSSVHMHWSLIRLLALRPALSQRAAIHRHFAARFTVANGRAELRYLRDNPGFERPYGWGWLLQLHSALLVYANEHAPALRWANSIAPVVEHVLESWRNFLPLSHYPQRAGTHGNSAFAMILAIRYSREHGDAATRRALSAAARRWFDSDRRYPAHYEPGGNDFLSPGLCEAMLMSEVHGRNFAQWWDRFAPTAKSLSMWMKPVVVGSRSDGQLVHLDGLNLSRAWCLRGLALRLPQHRAAFNSAATRHLEAALPYVTSGEFVATHWLVSFALLAMADSLAA